MQINNDTSKPCLVEARQGLSVLYQNRFLYSKYNPAANIERLVNSLEIKKDTLILCFSPILGYGLESLQKKIPSGCFMLAVEANPHLVELYNIKALPTDIGFLGPDRLKNIYNILTKKNQQFRSKLCIFVLGARKTNVICTFLIQKRRVLRAFIGSHTCFLSMIVLY